ncbi:MAG: N-acetylmuramoyl-L-alanine amidase [Pedobacter sp.]|nr:N-acetylmuramoyl-L-alanine amidase [Pedobacter sp.]
MTTFLKSGLLQAAFSFLLLVQAALFAAPVLAATEITALRSWRAPDNTRIVLDLNAPLKYRVSPDSTPARLIIELDDAQTAGPLALPAVAAPLKSMRFEKSGSGQRLVIETTAELTPKVFLLPPNEKYGNRLVLDLFDKAPVLAAASEAPKPVENKVAESKVVEALATPKPDALEKLIDKTASTSARPETVAPVMPPVAVPDKPLVAESKPAEKTVVEKAAPEKAAEKQPAPVEKYDAKRYRNVIVAIDAGHGGEDPGAIGQDGTHEKNVTLAIARELQAQLNEEPGITAVLTRTGDYFIPLQERRRIARYQHKADIFISIHADSAENRSARGASVFALSLKGAGSATSRFARMLAERENRSDLIGGVAIQNDDDILRNVLADMVVAGSLEHSLHMGRNILSNLDNVGRLHSKSVEQAGFAVLKEPGMVSLLVETGFISNPDEEKNLTSKSYQRELAKAVFDGVRRYCLQYPAPGTYFAWKADSGRAVAAVEKKPAAEPVKESAAQQSSQQPTLANAVDKAMSPPPPVKKSTPKYVRHKVTRGENLTRLASQYQVSMGELREVNKLRDDNVKIGQVLKIPVN